MTLANHIRVDISYTRSTHLERDVLSGGAFKPYLPTARALDTLERVLETMRAEQASRAWSLVGPYGSGKSSFAAFIAQLLGNSEDRATKLAIKALKAASPALAGKIARHKKDTRGYCRVLLTGSPEPLSRRLLGALAAGAQAFWSGRRGRTPKILSEIEQALDSETPTTTELVELLAQLQAAVKRAGGAGVLLVLDELGKFLEYDARHSGANDIYLLQALAEKAHGVSGGTPILLFVLLHQSIDQYARSISRTLRNEWIKVQGRFETIPFLDSSEQILRVVAEALRTDLDAAAAKALKSSATGISKELASLGALPANIDANLASELFRKCYPLHPVTALVLPILCHKVAQNERTLFSYLGSQEPHGLQNAIAQLELGEWVQPWRLYDYFIANQPAVTSDAITHRRWAEVIHTLERLDDATELERRLVKTIGLLNLIGAQGGLLASEAILDLSLSESIDDALRLLKARSAIQFRRYSHEYRVWQGSDFDLDSALADVQSQAAAFDLAETLNTRRPLHPVVARRYSIENGTLRHFQPVFMDAQSIAGYASVKDRHPQLWICMAESEQEQDAIVREISQLKELDTVAGIATNAGLLREAVSESVALERVRAERQELQGDPVAQREVSDRLDIALSREEELVHDLIARPEQLTWYWKGQSINVDNRQAFQRRLSETMQAVYWAAPIVRNELINRHKPSSQASSARHKLLFGLLRNRDREDLGFEKFPAEKGLYRALFKATGLHRVEKGVWKLTAPEVGDDPFNFLPFWERIEASISSAETEPLCFVSLDEELEAPPFGIKEGVLPILYLAVYLTNEHEVALYEDRMYVPHLTEAHIERFIRRPGSFSVQSFRLEGVRHSLFDEYNALLFNDTRKERTVLSIARPLLRFVVELPDYVRSTSNLSPLTLRVRNALVHSKSPQKLLFEAIPEACGIGGTTANSGLATQLREVLRELKYTYQKLLDDQRQLMCKLFQLPTDSSLAELRQLLAGRLAGLESYTIDSEGTKAFINRARSGQDDDATWFNSLLVFLSRKPVDKWTDSDRAAAELRLKDFARRLNDLRKLQVHYADLDLQRDSDFDVILLRAVRSGRSDVDEVAVLDADRYAATAAVVEEVRSALESLSTRDLQLAALAQVVEDALNNPMPNVVTSDEPNSGDRNAS